jgi:hypothetical protein
MEAIPDKDTYFRIGRFVGSVDKTMRQMLTSVVIDCWEKWFIEALDALRVLHAHGLVHGCLDLNAFRIDEENTLRIGNLSVVRKREDPLPMEAFRAQDLTYPPEVLFRFGREEGYAFSTMFEALKEKHSMFDLFPSFFPGMLLRQNFEKAHAKMDSSDSRAADIWMLANTFFRVYVDLLSNPKMIRSAFYKEKHDMFKEVLGFMLHPIPSVRPSAEAVLAEFGYKWKEYAVLDETDDEEEKEEEKQEVAASIDEKPVVSVVEHVEIPSIPDPQPLPQRKPRLVLTKALDRGGHNKTRKNPRS